MTCSNADCIGEIFNIKNRLCQPCYRRKWRLVNLGRVRLQEKACALRNKAATLRSSAKWKRTPEGRYSALVSEAGRRGLSMTIPFLDFVSLLSQACEYCEEVEIAANTGYRLDRIENSLGYSVQNVVPCCTSCNRIRGDNLSYLEMIVVMQSLTAFRKSVGELSEQA